ncbi:MAG: hypothetical protein RIS47_326, partial [Bacteroidota bacterium]
MHNKYRIDYSQIGFLFRIFWSLIFLMFGQKISFSQTEAANIEQKYSLETDVLNLNPQTPIGSTSSIATGVEEDSFGIPLPIFVVTRKEIERSGVKSIAEALRLVPGCFVSERTKSNYDVHLTHSTYLHTGAEDYVNFEGRSAIVLVDEIPVLQRMDNGIWFEMLPNIQSIEQIEVILSPMSAIHGQASGGGIINIVTRKLSYEKFHIIGDFNSDQTYSRSASIFGESVLSTTLSVKGNVDYGITQRDYDKISFFAFQREIPNDSLKVYIPEMAAAYPDMDLAQRYAKFSLSFNYNPNRDFDMKLRGGYVETSAQSNFQDLVVLFMMQRQSKMGNVDLKLRWKKWHFYSKMKTGTLNYSYGFKGTMLASLDYQNKIERSFEFKSLKLRAGGFYNYSSVNNRIDDKNAVINGIDATDTKFPNYGSYLHFDANPNEKLRILGAVSYEYFPDLERNIFAYNVGIGYKILPQTLLRLSTAQSYFSPSFERFTQLDKADYTKLYNLSLKPVLANQYEFGVRTQSSGLFNIDLSVFFREINQLQQGDSYDLANGFSNIEPEIYSTGTT